MCYKYFAFPSEFFGGKKYSQTRKDTSCNIKNRGLFCQTKTSSKPTYAGDVQHRIDSLSGICMWINTSSSTTAPLGAPSTPHLSPALWLLDDLLLNHVYHLIGYSEIFDGAPSDVTFGHSPKPITILSFKITNHHWAKHFLELKLNSSMIQDLNIINRHKVTYPRCTNDFPQIDVHPVITAD